MALRIGPPDQRCVYWPDFSGLDPYTNQFTLIEVKGAHVWEDARVKYMSAARLCQRWGLGFILMRKVKGTWQESKLA